MSDNYVLVPTLAKVRLTDTYRISKYKEEGGRLTMDLGAVLTLSSILKAGKLDILSRMDRGAYRFDMLLPYIGERTMEDWQEVSLGGKHETDRLLFLTAAGMASPSEEGEFATIYAAKKQIIFNMGAEEYDALPFGHRSNIVIHGFEGGSRRFTTLLVQLPQPDGAEGHYIYSDGSDAGNQQKDQPIEWGGGFVGRIGSEIISGTAGGCSVGGNADAELAAAVKGIREAADISGGELSDITVFFDYVGVGYWPMGLWKAKTPEAITYCEELRELSKSFKSIRFVHVDGHAGVRGNEIADRLADSAK